MALDRVGDGHCLLRDDVAQLLQWVVDLAVQGAGLGRALMQAAEDNSRHSGRRAGLGQRSARAAWWRADGRLMARDMFNQILIANRGDDGPSPARRSHMACCAKRSQAISTRRS